MLTYLIAWTVGMIYEPEASMTDSNTEDQDVLKATSEFLGVLAFRAVS
jgi:hypothetical protein